MKKNEGSNKVISLEKKVLERNARAKREGGSPKPDTRVMAITSGKGGVGKTNIVANLGFALSRLGKKVLIFDADLGLGNLDVLLGLAPRYNLSHVVKGEKSIQDIIIEGPGSMKILPASSGIQEMTRLSKEQKIQILTELDGLIDHIDILLIDTAAGISTNVMYFNVTAQEILVVATPEPTSMTDAYALMKVLSLKYSEKAFKLVVNMAADEGEAHDVFRQLKLVSDRFLDISIEYVGHVLLDKNVTRGVRMQKLVSELYPDTKASFCFETLAKQICGSVPSRRPYKGSNFFWEKLLQNELG